MSLPIAAPLGVDLVRSSLSLCSGLRVHAVDVSDVLRLSSLRMRSGKATHIVTVNPEIDQLQLRDRAYAAIVNGSEIRTCDGVGVQMAARLRGALVPPRVTGVALTRSLVELSIGAGCSVMVIGAEEGVRRRFEGQLTQRGGKVIEGTSMLIADVAAAAAQLAPRIPDRCIVLVALGAPRQESLIHALRRSCTSAAIYIGVGGAIDYLTGATVYPPAVIRTLGLEWLFRLATAPRKRLRRQLASLPQFATREVLLALRSRLGQFISS